MTDAYGILPVTVPNVAVHRSYGSPIVRTLLESPSHPPLTPPAGKANTMGKGNNSQKNDKKNKKPKKDEKKKEIKPLEKK